MTSVFLPFAQNLNVPSGIEEVPGLDTQVLHTLLHEDPDSWSAVTTTNGRKSVIILNSSHPGGRQLACWFTATSA